MYLARWVVRFYQAGLSCCDDFMTTLRSGWLTCQLRKFPLLRPRCRDAVMKSEAARPIANRGMITISIMLAKITQGVDNTIPGCPSAVNPWQTIRTVTWRGFNAPVG